MAAAVHGCGSSSPRQHHGSNISCTSPANSHHKHQPTISVYSTTMPKCTRSTTAQKATPPSNHRNIYGTSNPNASHQYNLPLPQVTYLPVGMGAISHQHAYATTQRPGFGTALTESCRNSFGHLGMYRVGRHHNKRKSAVELLAETKPFYIKSDTVIERLQQSNYRAATISIGSKRGRNSVDNRDEIRYKPPSYGDITDTTDMDHRFPMSPPHHQSRGPSHVHHHHHRIHHAHVSRHSVSPSNNHLQNKVRMFFGERPKDRAVSDVRNYINDLPQRRIDFTSKAISTGYNKEPAKVVFANDDDVALRLPPPSFLSPQPYENVYSYGADNSSSDEPLILTENYRPISPPAEYAAESNTTNNEQRASYRYNYQRSYSHSHEVAAKNSKFNINSHKSLPDLHSQISRHSPHSEILSCCSRGNRSIKSAGESSLNRDSGGSSGHYTHRSEPCYRQQRESNEREMCASKNCGNTIMPMDYRRDSGSSTQHSANSYCGDYASPSYLRSTDCTECRCKNEMRFESDEYLLNFTTPEVPEAFQDDYTPTSPSISKFKMEESQYTNLSTQQFINSKTCVSEKTTKNSIAQSPGSAPSMEDISPPPIQFKRQRCIRFKNRNRISLPTTLQPRSTEADTRELYHNRDKSTYFFPKCFSTSLYQNQEKRHSDTAITSVNEKVPDSIEKVQVYGSEDDLKDLEKFFDRLGLNDDRFHEIYSTQRRRRSAETDSEGSSTVFFSDVSTVDSMRLPDSTENQTATSQPYRPSEPPSIVERNARIIKWLCNCRKLQYA